MRRLGAVENNIRVLNDTEYPCYGANCRYRTHMEQLKLDWAYRHQIQASHFCPPAIKKKQGIVSVAHCLGIGSCPNHRLSAAGLSYALETINYKLNDVDPTIS